MVVAPAHRDNLRLTVHVVPGAEKFRAAARRIKGLCRPGIIYCATTIAVDEVGGRARARAHLRYHGKMRVMQRSRRLIMVATSAFGMGIDKPNIRYIVHYQARWSSTFRRLGAPDATGTRPTASSCSTPPTSKFRSDFRRSVVPVFGTWSRSKTRSPLGRGSSAPKRPRLAYSAGVLARIRDVLLSDLEQAGLIERDNDGGVNIVVPPESFGDGVRELVAKLKTFRYEGERRLRLVADYAQSKECLSVFLRRYFGEEHPARCATCDRCRAHRVAATHAGPSGKSRSGNPRRTNARPQIPVKNARQ
jgi:ATP-dependent DNA helicase RecQ